MKRTIILVYSIALFLGIYQSALSVEVPCGEASWSKTYISAYDMTNASKLIVIGKITRSYPEIRHDMVFTRFVVEVEHFIKGKADFESIEVVMTGGRHKGVETPVISDNPLLTVGSEYLLCLQPSGVNDPWGDYFSITGGNQGYALIEDGLINPIESDRNLIKFGKISNVNKILTDTSSANIKASTPVPTNGRHWIKTKLSFYVPAEVATNYGTYTRNLIVMGITSWNNIHPNISISETTNVSFDIGVFMNNYGATGWDGYHMPTESAPGVMEFSHIQLNVFYRGYGTSTVNLWKAVSCHEVGHSLGLGPANLSVRSIMAGDSASVYYDQLSIASPQTADRQTIIAIYDNVY